MVMNTIVKDDETERDRLVRVTRNAALEEAALVAEETGGDMQISIDITEIIHPEWDEGYLTGCKSAAKRIRKLKQE